MNHTHRIEHRGTILPARRPPVFVSMLQCPSHATQTGCTSITSLSLGSGRDLKYCSIHLSGFGNVSRASSDMRTSKTTVSSSSDACTLKLFLANSCVPSTEPPKAVTCIFLSTVKYPLKKA